jgi:hypothetical protein
LRKNGLAERPAEEPIRTVEISDEEALFIEELRKSRSEEVSGA